jgi:hypothetical protein
MLTPSPRHSVWLLALLGLGCRSDYSVKTDRTSPELTLEVFTPTYGEFLGDEAARITGKVSPAQAILEVEGELVTPEADGSFTVDVPLDHDWRWLEVEARLDAQQERWRTPVFRGEDPAPLWPGGITARFQPRGYDALGATLGATIDGLDWAGQLEAVLPGYEDGSGWFAIRPVGVFHDPTQVVLEPLDGAIGLSANLVNVKLEYELAVDIIGLSTELSVTFANIGIEAQALPTLDEADTLWLELAEASIALDTPDFQITVLDGWLLELVVEALSNYVLEPVGDLILGLVLDELGRIELFGPLSGELDLLGVPLTFAVNDMYAETLGLGLEAGIGIGESVADSSLGVPVPDQSSPGAEDAHLTAVVHEGLFQVAMADLLVGIFEGELGSYLAIAAPLLGAMVEGLPGGEQVPAGDGWCLDIQPGDVYLARMHEGTAPLASIYLPDLQFEMGRNNAGNCTTWIKASLATEIDLAVDGSALQISLGMPEGALLEYGAEGVDEDEVVTALATGISGALGTIIGGLSIDLAELLGGATGEADPADPLSGLLTNLAIEVTASEKMLEDDGSWEPGTYAISLKLFAE